MAKYSVVLTDGRTLSVFAPDEEGAKKQVMHQETSRIVIATKRGHDITVPPSFPFSVTKLKD